MAAASACGLIAAAQSAGVGGISAGTNIGIGVGAGKAGGLQSPSSLTNLSKKKVCVNLVHPCMQYREV